MFTAGRILRGASSNSRRGAICVPETSHVARRHRAVRCYVPFVWQSLMTSLAGLAIVIGGLTLSVIGFYHASSGSMSRQQPGHVSSSQVTNISVLYIVNELDVPQ